MLSRWTMGSWAICGAIASLALWAYGVRDIFSYDPGLATTEHEIVAHGTLGDQKIKIVRTAECQRMVILKN